ncbi:hypothetical protein QVD17_21597 [Tagetes erecta]|uniref:Glabrous enhancer-binding protein-like DBD domain-containing protein n=1 Tax=Tagetes erecta TaxID=13708 RepID=A0AAD8NT77_TARER|nr:hypothetical protein QVD17_21597 [Tagetes erecta]
MDTPKSPSSSYPDIPLLPPRKRHSRSFNLQEADDTNKTAEPTPRKLEQFSASYPDITLLPPRKQYSRSFTFLQEDINTDDIVTDKSIAEPITPTKLEQFAVPKEVKDGSASRTIIAWKKLHEINLLKSIIEYHNQNRVYPFDDLTHMQKFYKSWIETNGVYIDEEVFSNKMVDLPERFYKNQVKLGTFGANLKAWMPPVEVAIYELSDMIWGNKDDDFEDDFDDVDLVGEDDDEGGTCIDPKNDDDDQD